MFAIDVRSRSAEGFVELGPELSGSALERVLFHAYRLGTDAPVLVWRNGHSLKELDDALGSAVAALGTDRAGIEYVDEAEPDRAAAGAKGTRFCVLTSDRLRPYLDSATRIVGIDDLPAIGTFA